MAKAKGIGGKAKAAPRARKALSDAIRELRKRLIDDIRETANAVYRLSLPAERADLPDAARLRRASLDAWLDEQVRATKDSTSAERPALRNRFLDQAVKEAAYTWLNRLVFLRLCEERGLVRTPLVKGGWNSAAFTEFRAFAKEICRDEAAGYQILLGLVCDDWASELPGLFDEVGTMRLFPLAPAALRTVVERLNDPALAEAWRDDTTLGWIYQYWNDPDREALDTKLDNGGEIEVGEIASKTQMFTERYIVEWLLQNSLGWQWLCICRRNGWTADADAVIADLETRRAEWRARREGGEVALDALMPVDELGLEGMWKYYLPQPIPADAVKQVPESVRMLKVLDPACGSGHFLVIAFDLLSACYGEEARHRGETWAPRQIAESILENNLHGVDIDPRAVQIAAAALYLKAKTYARDCRIRQINLVAPALRLGRLPSNDPALIALRREVRAETGLPEALTDKIVGALRDVDHLGTLLKVDSAIEEAIHGLELDVDGKKVQGKLFGGFPAQQVKITAKEAKATVLDKLEQFLGRHAGAEDLGLRLDGEQLAAGVRFVRIVKAGNYDLVVGNPPYQGTSKMADAEYVKDTYQRGKADLYAAFLERGLQLVRQGGVSALLTMRGWMFLEQFEELRAFLLANDLRLIGDLDRGAFEDVPDEVLAVCISVVRAGRNPGAPSIALQPTDRNDRSRDAARTARKRAANLSCVGRYDFDQRRFASIPGQPLVYWWSQEFIRRYEAAPKLSSVWKTRNGMSTQDNARFLRKVWEVFPTDCQVEAAGVVPGFGLANWAPYVKGAKGRQWIEPFEDVVRWVAFGLEPKAYCQHLYGSHSRTIKSESFYFQLGVAFSAIGNNFSSRVHRTRAVFGHMGASVFTEDLAGAVCLMNSTEARSILGSLNPGVHFLASDVGRLPFFPIPDASAIYATLDRAFTEHESAREASTEFRRPGPSSWRYAQSWAQRAVDRPPDSPLPSYVPEYDPPKAEQYLSFAFGIAMGRFGADGEGWLSIASQSSLPNGILFLSNADGPDDLNDPAVAALREAWSEHGPAVSKTEDLRTWLRRSFFKFHVKKGQYDARPIYLPLSSKERTFVAWVSIHRWNEKTLETLLADKLLPEKLRLDGLLGDLKQALAVGDSKVRVQAEKHFPNIREQLRELEVFINDVMQVAQKGPPPTGMGCQPRERDARPFAMDLDDGVLVNSAALWPLLAAQWSKPAQWWTRIANQQGPKGKDFDWAHLTERYFPTRVDEKCRTKDPSLAVAHRRFWRYHPERAYQWELRLQDEIRPDFTIDEPDSDDCRRRFLGEHAERAEEIRREEIARRMRKARKAGADEDDGPQGSLDLSGSSSGEDEGDDADE